MGIPQNLLENTEAALAVFAALLAACGLLACGAAYFFVFLFLQNADGMVSPQIDSAETALGNVQATMASAAESTQSASEGIASLSSALASYSSASKNISDSISDISKVPPFSLDSRFSSSAASLKMASAYFADAAKSVNATAEAANGTFAGVKKTAADLDSAKSSLQSARKSFKDALGALHLAALAGFFSLGALFSSVMLLSSSVLLSHYPRFFEANPSHAERSNKK